MPVNVSASTLFVALGGKKNKIVAAKLPSAKRQNQSDYSLFQGQVSLGNLTSHPAKHSGMTLKIF